MQETAKDLFDNGILGEESYNKIKNAESNPLFSLFWELRTLLYLGVLLFTGGFGIIVYQTIDTIGHQAILFVIAVLCIGCFFYCFKNAEPYKNDRVKNSNTFFDYILLTGCLLFLTFEGYIQFKYQIFGIRYGLAAIIPTITFFFIAYRFDNLSILSMAITGLAAWAGITITPLHVIDSNDFTGHSIIYTAEVLGIALCTAGWVLMQKGIKSHFFYTYVNFATHLLFVSTLSGLFLSEGSERFLWFTWILLLAAASFMFAKKEKSFYFLLIAIIYTYVGLTYVFFKSIDWDGDTIAWLGMWYFIASCAGIIYFLVNHKKIIAKVFYPGSEIDTSNDHL